MSESNAKSGGIGLGGAIFIVFLILKLAEIGQVATWSWWWVTSPLWISFLLGVTLFVVFGIIAIIVAILDK